MNKVVDPVCHMQIDPAKAAGSSTFNGDTYYFCSRGCQTKFHVAPDGYVATVAPEPGGGGCATGHSCC